MSRQLRWHQRLSGMINVIQDWAHQSYSTVWSSYCACSALVSQQGCIHTTYCMSSRILCLKCAEPTPMLSEICSESTRACVGGWSLTYSQHLILLLDACTSPSLECEIKSQKFTVVEDPTCKHHLSCVRAIHTFASAGYGLKPWHGMDLLPNRCGLS